MAAHVFADPFAVSLPDPFPDEERWRTIGMPSASSTAVLFVVHTIVDEEGGRIISAAALYRMKGRPMKKGNSEPLSDALKAELAALEALSDDTIDTSDIPPVTDWSKAERGRLYKPVKQQLSLRLDADVLEWFKTTSAPGEKYQTRINRVLREYVVNHREKRA